jgi:hypothetical protein
MKADTPVMGVSASLFAGVAYTYIVQLYIL